MTFQQSNDIFSPIENVNQSFLVPVFHIVKMFSIHNL